MPQFVLDALDKMPAVHLKTAIIILSIFFVTGGSGYNAIMNKHDELSKESVDERARIEKEVDARFDLLERREAALQTTIETMAEQIKQMHSVIYRPINGG